MARAKVNLYLHVTGRRADGYHELGSLVVFPEFGDQVAVRRADRWSVVATGPLAGSIATLKPADNVAVKAGAALLRVAGRNEAFEIQIEKHIPAGAGLGGGSADAAAVLHLLNEQLRLGLSLADLLRVGISVGADVPVCLLGSGAFVGGIGEVVEPATTPALHLALVWPAQPLATATVFKALPAGAIRVRPRPGFAAGGEGFVEGLRGADNDLAPPARALMPNLAAVLRAIEAQPDCRLARMTGSGSCCFGLFASALAADAAARAIQAAHPGWWTRAASTVAS